MSKPPNPFSAVAGAAIILTTFLTFLTVAWAVWGFLLPLIFRLGDEARNLGERVANSIFQ